MRLLVTGGAGFIGSNFVQYWLAQHPADTIVNLDKLTYAGNIENLLSIKGSPRHCFIKGDICDPRAVAQAMGGVDTIVHFAAESHVDRAIVDASDFLRTNLLGTHVLLEEARKRKVRFHHVSTDEVFGELPLDSTGKFSEQTLYQPRNPYSASKAGSDHLVRSYYHTHKLPVTISNCSNNYGPHQFPEKFIPVAITNVIGGKPIPVYGDGGNVRDWLFVEDHCRAIEHVLEKGAIGETYCIGGMTENVTNLEVAKKIIALLGSGEIKFVTDRPGHDRRYAVDWGKAKAELGWQPRQGFEEGLHKTVDWYVKNKDWWKRVKSGEYKERYACQ